LFVLAKQALPPSAVAPSFNSLLDALSPTLLLDNPWISVLVPLDGAAALENMMRQAGGRGGGYSRLVAVFCAT
jgi:hypothetical protein